MFRLKNALRAEKVPAASNVLCRVTDLTKAVDVSLGARDTVPFALPHPAITVASWA